MNISIKDPLVRGSAEKIKTIGVLTGGGDCPGLNAVIRSVVKTASKGYGLKVIGILDGFEGLIHKKTVNLNFDSVKGIIDKGGTILGSSNKANPFEYISKENPGKTKDLSLKVIENISKLEMDALIVIGGDGTMSIASKLAKAGVNIVGVPKTIDNDLPGTDQTFGFDTALTTATEAIDKIRTTAQSHHRVMMVEVMGRNTGWIALKSGLASGADIILIPEIPYLHTKLFKAIQKRMDKKRNFTILVIAEGAKPVGGKEVIKMHVQDSAFKERLGGVSYKLAEEIRQQIDVPCRATVLGHIQRGGVPSPFDRILGTQFGHKAVELVCEGSFSTMVSLKGSAITSVSLDKASHSIKKVDKNGELVQCAKDLGVIFGD